MIHYTVIVPLTGINFLIYIQKWGVEISHIRPPLEMGHNIIRVDIFWV